MPTPKRRHRRNCNEPGHVHELTFSCYHGFQFLSAERVCEWLAKSIDKARVKWKFDLWAFVFMPEHVHLVVRPRETVYDIADHKKAIKAPVAVKAIEYLELNAPDRIPKITRMRGGKSERLFWQSGGGYDRNVTEQATLLRMIEYIHMNPVRRGLVERAADWKWSSAGWFLEGRDPPLRLDPIPPEWCAGQKRGGVMGMRVVVDVGEGWLGSAALGRPQPERSNHFPFGCVFCNHKSELHLDVT